MATPVRSLCRFLNRLVGRGLVVAVAILAALLASRARATSVMTVSPEQVLANSDIIFQGTVLSRTSRWTGPHKEGIVTDYAIRIAKVFNDSAGALGAITHEGVVKLTFAGGTMEGTTIELHGPPTFSPDEQAFFCIAGRDIGSICPTLGMWQGVYRVGNVNGQARVTRVAACCGQRSMVSSHFFSKLADIPGGFSPEEFAEEITRALPIAKTHADLLIPAPGTDGPMDGAHVYSGDRIQACVPGSSDVLPVDQNPRVPTRRDDGPVAPATGQVVMVEDPTTDRTDIQQHFGPRFGYFSGPQAFPISFSINPGTWWNGPMQQQEAYWNVYADLFRVRSDSNNNIGWPNNRNEIGFLTGPNLDSVYHMGVWGSTTYGVCYTRATNHILESDIILNESRTWTADYATGWAAPSGGVVYLPSVVLHELGHSFGLNHSWLPNPGATFPSIMNYVPQQYFLAELRHVFADDSQGIRGAYTDHASLAYDRGLYLWYNTGAQAAQPTPNNIVTNSTFQPSVQAGNSFTLTNFYMENVGTSGTSATADFWLTPQHGNYTGAVYCSTSALGGLSPGTGARLTRTISVPSWCPGGVYYIAANIANTAYSGNNDVWGDNNHAWSNGTITVVPAPAPVPGNDLKQNAWHLEGTVTVTGTTIGATNAFFDAMYCDGSYDQSPDVWYTYSAVTTGPLTVDTCGSGFDTRISIIRPDDVILGCNDDATNCANRGSRLTVNVAAGQGYYIRVSGYQGLTGTFTLRTSIISANNSCTGATIVPVYGGDYNVNVATATQDGTTTCGLSNSTRDIWFAYRADCNATMTVRTFEIPVNIGGFDTVLSVHSGCPGTAANTIACNDDCVILGQTYTSSCLNFTVAPNTTYYVRLSGYNGATGSASVRFDQPYQFNAVCTSPSIVHNGDNHFTSICGSYYSLPEYDMTPCGLPPGFLHGVSSWFKYTPTADGVLDVRMCATSYEACTASVYQGGSCPPDSTTTCLGCFYDTPQHACATPAPMTISVVAGTDYLIRIGGYYFDPQANPQPIGGTGTLSLAFRVPVVLTGACCASNGACTVSALAVCIGTYQGDDTACDPTPCPIAVGACCQATACSLQTEADCLANNGFFLGLNTTCQLDPANPQTCCPANFDGAAGLGVADIFAFLTAWFDGDPRADFNNVNGIDVADIFSFLSGWFAGCQ